MAQATLPISAILREKSLDVEKKKSREDWRKAKELEEARKAGTAPAAVDEEGRDINPHIPQYISAAPWYYNTKGPTLKHQRPQSEEETNKPRTEEWYKRGLTTSIATKFRKGACENCGAITHKRKDCLERPRKVGARFGGGRILADEAVQPNLDLDFESKRDRWNGYDASEHVKVVQEFADVEDMKRRLKAEKLKKEMLEGAGEDSDDEAGEDEDKYVDDIDMPGTKVDSKQRITVRNLRIREDTAKYLRNLDPNSAYYDPKTRSMRDNPYKEAARDPTEVDYAGENFVRYSGDTMEHARAQMFAWEAHEKGVDVHNLADPTKLELLHKEFQKKKDQFKTEIKGGILEKYGGYEHLDAPPKELLLAQTEDYVEYSRSGKIVKGMDSQKIRSRYEEDVYINNHTSVWGSFWKDGQWGYKCCHSFVKNSYCTGEKGIALEQAGSVATGSMPPPLAIAGPSSSAVTISRKRDSESEEDEDEEDKKKLVAGTSASAISQRERDEESLRNQREKRKRKKEAAKEKRKAKKEDKKRKKMKKKKESSSSSSSSSSSDSSDDDEDEEEKKKRLLKKALEQEDKRRKEADELLAMDERKRPYNSMFNVKQPTEEEMEAYFMKRGRDDDPMAKFV